MSAWCDSHSTHCQCCCCCRSRGLNVQAAALEVLRLRREEWEEERRREEHWSYDPDAVVDRIVRFLAKLEREGTLDTTLTEPDADEMFAWANFYVGDMPGLHRWLGGFRVDAWDAEEEVCALEWQRIREGGRFR